MSAPRRFKVLAVVATDSTFSRRDVRGEPHFVGKCIHCNAALVVALDGSAPPSVTIEHIVPRGHGGTDDPRNLALACARCNSEKGLRHDSRSARDSKRLAVVERLAARRAARYREPEG